MLVGMRGRRWILNSPSCHVRLGEWWTHSRLLLRWMSGLLVGLCCVLNVRERPEREVLDGKGQFSTAPARQRRRGHPARRLVARRQRRQPLLAAIAVVASPRRRRLLRPTASLPRFILLQGRLARRRVALEEGVLQRRRVGGAQRRRARDPRAAARGDGGRAQRPGVLLLRASWLRAQTGPVRQRGARVQRPVAAVGQAGVAEWHRDVEMLGRVVRHGSFGPLGWAVKDKQKTIDSLDSLIGGHADIPQNPGRAGRIKGVGGDVTRETLPPFRSAGMQTDCQQHGTNIARSKGCPLAKVRSRGLT